MLKLHFGHLRYNNRIPNHIVLLFFQIILENETILTNRGYLERTVTTMVWALFNCRETETLNGLRLWLKSKQFQGFEWIQYVADHSSGHLEKAISGYSSVLSNSSTTVDAFTKEFIEKQLMECLYNTGKWSEILQMVNSSAYSQFHLQCMNFIYESAVKSSGASNNDAVANAIWKMTEWSEDSKCNKPAQRVDSFSFYEIASRLREACLARSICVAGDDIAWFEPFKDCIRQALHHSVYNNHEPGTSLNMLNEILLLNHSATKMELLSNVLFHNSNTNTIPTELSNKILCWSLIVDKKLQKENLPLLLEVIHKSRLDTNFSYSQSLLEQFFFVKGVDQPLEQMIHELKSNDLRLDFSDSEVVSGLEELIKCVYAQSNSIVDSMELASACCVQIIEKEPCKSTVLPETISNILLTMYEWICSHRVNNHNISHGKQFQALQRLLPDVDFCSAADKKIPAFEYAVGKLLNGSILCRDNCGEAWFSFGNWCYRWGKKLMETSGNSSDQQELNQNHAAIQNILGDRVDNEIVKQIVQLLNTHIANIMSDDNVEDEVYVDGAHNPTEKLERDLMKLCSVSPEQLNDIICLWRQEHKGVYGFYEEATRAYFKYLTIQSDAVSDQKSSSIGSEVEDCTFVTTTLRLLRLIVKHAQGLQVLLSALNKMNNFVI